MCRHMATGNCMNIFLKQGSEFAKRNLYGCAKLKAAIVNEPLVEVCTTKLLL